MRKSLPVPIVAAILAAAILALGYILWRATSASPNAERTEELLNKAFGGKGGGVSIPPPPAGAKPAR